MAIAYAADGCAILPLTLNLEHREVGPITLELPTPLEERMAMEYLTPLLGKRLVSGVVWDKKKQPLVKKPLAASI